MASSPTAPRHRHKSDNVHRQWAWLPSDCTSSRLLVSWCPYRRCPPHSLYKCMTQRSALSSWAMLILPNDHPSPTAAGLAERAPDEPIVQSPTKPHAMETQSDAASRSESLPAQAAGTGKMLAVLAFDAQHHQLSPGALTLAHVRCIGVGVADSWSGDPIAELLKRLIAQMGRPVAYLKDGGSELQKAVAILDEQGLASPCIDDISHAIAGMLKRSYQDHPTLATFLAACGRVSGKLKHTILACLAPPKVRTKARFMSVYGLFTWADQVLGLSPAGGAKPGSTLAKLRACLDQLPACKAFIKRFRTDAHGLLECQKILKTKGLSHDTRAQCEPLMATMPSSALRQELRAYLDFELETATTLGLDHVGLPISSDAIESLFGAAKRHGVGETQDANRIALRLPAFCGVPTREEAEQVLRVSVARQQELTAQCTSLSKQRREVLGHPEHLESLSLEQATPHVELMPSPKNRSNYQEIIDISNSYEECHGPPLPNPGRLHFLENAEPPGRRETALTS